MDTYQKVETVEAEQWNKLGDVKEADIKKYEQTDDGWLRASASVGDSQLSGLGNRVRQGDYIVKAYDIGSDSTVYYPVSKEEFEFLWLRVVRPEWEGDGDVYVPA